MPAIASHSTATSGKSWDGPANEARLDNDGTAAYYRRAFAWADPDKDASTKAAYKFIHHEVSADGTVGAANLAACSAGIAVLNGGRGGAKIPESDRRGVWRHLARHLTDAGREAPDLKSGRGRTVFMLRKNMPLDVKQLKADGTFEGWLSRYGEVDLVKDVVEPGAYTKTLQQSGGTVPLLWQHDDRQPIGHLELEDRDEGLYVKRGRLLVKGVQKAREAYALIKDQTVRKMMGLSIGYRVIRKDFKDGVRHLKEIALFEGSLVTFPALESARLTDVKALDGTAFMDVLEQVRLSAEGYQLMQALSESLYRIVYDHESAPDDKIKAVDESINDFHDAYLEFLPRWLGAKSLPDARESLKLPPAAIEMAKTASGILVAAIEDAESGSPESNAVPASKDAGDALEEGDADASEDKAVLEWLTGRSEVLRAKLGGNGDA